MEESGGAPFSGQPAGSLGSTDDRRGILMGRRQVLRRRHTPATQARNSPRASPRWAATAGRTTSRPLPSAPRATARRGANAPTGAHPGRREDREPHQPGCSPRTRVAARKDGTTTGRSKTESLWRICGRAATSTPTGATTRQARCPAHRQRPRPGARSSRAGSSIAPIGAGLRMPRSMNRWPRIFCMTVTVGTSAGASSPSSTHSAGIVADHALRWSNMGGRHPWMPLRLSSVISILFSL